MLALQRHDLIQHADCVEFLLPRNEEPGFDGVDVREKHDARCGGDPDTAPRLFSVRIDRKTGRMQTEASRNDQLEGTLTPLD